MPDESTTPDLVELSRALHEAGDICDLDAVISFFAPGCCSGYIAYRWLQGISTSSRGATPSLLADLDVRDSAAPRSSRSALLAARRRRRGRVCRFVGLLRRSTCLTGVASELVALDL